MALADPLLNDDSFTLQLERNQPAGIIFSFYSPVLLFICADSPAGVAGAAQFIGRTVVGVNGEKIDSFEQCFEIVSMIKQHGGTVTYKMTPGFDSGIPQKLISFLLEHGASHGITLDKWGEACTANGVLPHSFTPDDVCQIVAKAVGVSYYRADARNPSLVEVVSFISVLKPLFKDLRNPSLERNAAYSLKYVPSYARIPWNTNQRYQERTVGPAVPGAYIVLCIVWSAFILLMIIGDRFTSCSASGAAQYSGWLVLMFAAVLSFALALEFRCMRYSIVAQAAWLDHFSIFGKKLPFRMWLVGTFSLSVLSHMDVFTNTMFVLKVSKTNSCMQHSGGKGYDIDSIWTDLLQQSLLAHVPWINQASFSSIVVMSWFCMLLQPAYAILMTFPTRESINIVRSKPGLVPKGHFYSMSTSAQSFTFNTLLTRDQTTNHSSALMTIAGAARMAAVIQEHPAMLRALANGNNAIDLIGNAPIFYAEIRRTVVWFLLRMVTEVAAFANLQSSFFALSRVASRDHGVDQQTIISLILGTAVAGYSTYLDSQRILVYRDKLEKADHDAALYLSFSHQEEAFHDYAKSARFFVRAFIVSVTGFVFLQCYALLKLLMAFVCKDYVWNLVSCADLSGLLK